MCPFKSLLNEILKEILIHWSTKELDRLPMLILSAFLLPTCVNDIVEVVGNPVNKDENIINKIWVYRVGWGW